MDKRRAACHDFAVTRSGARVVLAGLVSCIGVTVLTPPGHGARLAAEAAFVVLALAAELGPRHIHVNAIRPGMVETEGTHSAGITESDFRKQVEAQTPLGRIGQPQDIANAAVFLASADSSWITGETFLVSGGYR